MSFDPDSTLMLVDWDAEMEEWDMIEKTDMSGNQLPWNVWEKKLILEMQQETFWNAPEETILEQYKELKKAHLDFMSEFRKAQYVKTQTDNKELSS